MTPDFKSGFVAIIGRPNVGKSTLMNHLIGQKIAITSKKPQTTRNRIQTVYTCEKGQIVFLDTPGIHKAKNKLGEYMVAVAERTLKEVDAIMWLVEPSTFIGAGERHIAEQLQGVGVPVILIINKIDTVKKEEILPAIDTYRKICDFAEIIPCSALRGQNTEDIIDSILKYLPYGPMFYDEDTVTDQPQRQIVAEVIREKALHALDAEIPHGILDGDCLKKASPGEARTARRISQVALYTMQYIVSSPMTKLYSFTVTDEVLWELERHIQPYVAGNTDKKFKSLQILEVMM